MASSSGDLSLQTYAANAPITRERKLNLNLQDQMPQPYLARAIVAADPAHPNGSDGHDHNNMSVLQQHASFFDRNKDGIIYPWETCQGFRAIGCGLILSSMAAVLLNLVLSYSTLPGYLPSLLLPIYIKNIHRCKHGSDSESYNTEGSKYSTTHPDALTSEELSTMLRANRNLTDFNGWILSWTEWKLLYILGKDEKGLLHRETIRAVYDGTLFERLEKERASGRKRA